MSDSYAIEKFLNLKVRFKLIKSVYFVLMLSKGRENTFFISKKLLKSLIDLVNFQKLVVKYPLFLTYFNCFRDLQLFCEKEVVSFSKIRFISLEGFKFYKQINLVFNFFASIIYQNLDLLLSTIKNFFSFKF